MQIRFHPTLQILRFNWNVGPIARAISSEDRAPEPAVLDSPETWVVWRRGLTVYFRSLDEAESDAMDAFVDGRTFTDVCAALCAWLDAAAVPASMAGMLNQWVSEG